VPCQELAGLIWIRPQAILQGVEMTNKPSLGQSSRLERQLDLVFEEAAALLRTPREGFAHRVQTLAATRQHA